LPHFLRRTVAEKVRIEFIEADVDIGFSLVDEAKACRAAGQPQFSSSALQQAAEILAKIELRIQQLGATEAAPFALLIAALRDEIAAVERETPP